MFGLEIETGNAAFGESDEERAAEIARLLEHAAKRIRDGEDSGNLYDYNGNKVGRYSLTA